MAEGKIKAKMFNTKPELKVLASYVSRGYKEGVDIIKQYYVIKGVGLVDFFLPKENTLVFVGGDYWHCNPEKYKPCYYHQNLHKFAYDVQQRDKSITEKCKTFGYKIIRLWETEIYNLKQEE